MVWYPPPLSLLTLGVLAVIKCLLAPLVHDVILNSHGGAIQINPSLALHPLFLEHPLDVSAAS